MKSIARAEPEHMLIGMLSRSAEMTSRNGQHS
jgi:hypothetical protein